MNTRIYGIAFLIAGIVLLVHGFHAADSIASSFSKIFTGAPTEKSMWMLVCGTVLTAFGAYGVAHR